MASKTSFYNNSGVTNEQSNAIDASVSNAEASATSASNSATAAANSATAAANSATAAANSASSASASATTATTSKDAAVVAKDAAVVAKNAAEASAVAVSGALAKSNNLSDLTNASTARTNLGVAIGSDVQAYSSVLQSTTAAYTSALNTKLSGIEANATADQTKSDIDALGINATSVSGFTVGKSVPSNAVFTDTNTTYSIGDGGLTQKNFTTTLKTKLDGIESGATADQTKSDIDALGINATSVSGFTVGKSVPSNAVFTDTTYTIGDGGLTTNDFTNADHTKLNGIETGATADQTKSDIDALGINASSVSGFTVGVSVPSSALFTDTNTTYSVGDGGLTQKNFTTTLNTKLDGIATGATAYTDANAVSAVTASDLDMDGNKVLFSNMYSTLNDLPSATDNHGMFAHVHATGKGYFAHGGNWIELANASDVTTYTHPNHTGEVTSTSDGATVIADNVVDEANLKVSNTPTDGYVLTAQSGNTGGLTWAEASGGGSGNVSLGNWTITESSGQLLFSYNGVVKADLSPLGGFTSKGDVNAGTANENFEFTILTQSANDTFIISTHNTGTFNAVIDWGDNTSSTITSYNDSDLSHTYVNAGTYAISVSGSFPNVFFDAVSNQANKVKTVTNLGSGWLRLDHAFQDCNLVSFSTGDVDTSTLLPSSSLGDPGYPAMHYLFHGCTRLGGLIDLRGMDVSSLSGLAQNMFWRVGFYQTIGTPTLTVDLSYWDTSGFTNTVSMFELSKFATINLTGWDTSNVLYMGSMFKDIGVVDIINIGNLSIASLSSTGALNDFLTNSTIPTASYDALLVNWNSNLPTGGYAMSPNFGNSTYTSGSAADTARTNLINTHGWTISDGGSV